MSRQLPFDVDEMLQGLPRKPGVYRMLDVSGTSLYIGKARNLRDRVRSYFRSSARDTKTMALLNRVHDVQVTMTNSETEALLLEQNLIKLEKPRYNVIFRDGKSYPYIHLSKGEYPSLTLYRGSRNLRGRFFGPFPSAHAVRQSLSILQKLFRIRSCDDTFFKNRSRPCLQYQIGRCTAPCVSMPESEHYPQDLRRAVMFLDGRSHEVLEEFQSEMHEAADALDFERAAQLRDRIESLRRVQEAQYVDGASGNVDVFGIAQDSHYACVHCLFVRDGRILGHRNWFLSNELGRDKQPLLSEFISQFYLGSIKHEIPASVLTSVQLDDSDALSSALSEIAKRNVDVVSQARTHRARWIRMVRENAKLSLESRQTAKRSVRERILDFQENFGLDDVPERFECFDISHSAGEATVASCVVFDQSGPLKSDYRRFNIRDVEPGDDYGAMEQALRRHYETAIEQDLKLPDVLLIDGGKGQVRKAVDVLNELQITGIFLIGIAKGPERKLGMETIHTADRGIVELPPMSKAMHLLQNIRDEAHRFAITGHRSRRQKRRRHSQLDDIAGIGVQRKRDLLAYFGTLSAIKGASIEELTKVRGISRTLAEVIFSSFHAS